MSSKHIYIKELDAKILRFLAGHHVMTLATSANNTPYCCSCFYVYNAKENTFIITSDHGTRHVDEMVEQPLVSAAIALETTMIGKIQGLQITGLIKELTGDEYHKAKKTYLKKFPVAAFAELVLWSIEPAFMKYTDNRLGFGKKMIWEKNIAMKKEKPALGFMVFVLLLALCLESRSQGTSINTTGAPSAPSAILDVSSTAQGILIPRMTASQRNSIASPDQALMIYNLSAKCFEIYENSQWQSIWCSCTAPSAAGSISGSATVCQGQSGVSYTIAAIANATTYVWAYTGTGATINGSTNTVTIDFSAGATPGNLTVYGSSTCGSGSVSAAFPIAVNAALPAAAGSISGTANVCQGQNSVSFTVAAIANATSYVWSYTGTGATITGSSNSITISFSGSATSGNLTVYGTNNCGNGAISAPYVITVNSGSSILAGNTTSAIASGITTISIPKPSGTTTGDVLITGITINAPTLPMTPPTGWNLVQQSSGGNCTALTYYKVAGGSEPSSYSFGFNGTSYSSAIMTRFSNVVGTGSVDASSVASGYVAPSVTTSVNNEMLVLVTASGNGGNTFSAPAGWSAGFTGAQNCTSTGVFYKVQAAAGSTGSVAASNGMGDTGNIFLIALKPSACP